MREAVSSLRLEYAQFQELEQFTRFGTQLDPKVHQQIARGRRIRAALAQPRLVPQSVATQIVLVIALQAGLFDAVMPADFAFAVEQLAQALEGHPELCQRLAVRTAVDAEEREGLQRAMERLNMEQRAADVQARLATVSSFGELVGAMQGVAAARAEHARKLIAGTNAYARAVANAMGQALALVPADQRSMPNRAGQRPLWVLFCAEQAFNGGLSEKILAEVPNIASERVMLLGAQGLRLAPTKGLHPE